MKFILMIEGIKMDEEFINELRNYTLKQMKEEKSPVLVSKLVAELMELQR